MNARHGRRGFQFAGVVVGGSRRIYMSSDACLDDEESRALSVVEMFMRCYKSVNDY